MSQKLMCGVYAVSNDFQDKEGLVTFHFKGEVYEAQIGVNAFALAGEALEKATEVPAEPFAGEKYDTPVVVFPAGVYKLPRELSTPIPRAMTLLGEGAGVNPNRTEEKGWPLNPDRAEKESRIVGLFYFGTFVVPQGVEGCVTVDGLTLDTTRVHDRRTVGQNLDLQVKNCIFEGSLTHNLVYAAPLAAGSTRSLLLENCRADGIDSLDDEGGLCVGCSSELTIRGLYFAHTRKFLGLTNYDATIPSVPAGTDARITVEDSLFTDCEAVHGFATCLPKDAGNVEIIIQNCTFDRFAALGEPVFCVRLPHEGCSFNAENVSMIARKNQAAPAIIIEGGRNTRVNLADDVSCDGFNSMRLYKPERRTEAPDYVGSFVWSRDRLEDPHQVVESDFAQVEALYSGRNAYHGDMHAHTDSGGTSDGATPLAEFAKQLKALKVDFAAIVDHRQMRHMFLPEWDDTLFICGTEPGTSIVEEGREPRSTDMHYVMLFQHPTDLARVMAAFPEFEYTGGPDGHFKYPKFTPERLAELARFCRGLGGAFSHAHPKQLMASDNPLHFYFTDAVILETLNTNANSYGSLQNLRLWESLLKMGKRMHTVGCSDTHTVATDRALTTVYARERKGAAYLREIREGDCTSGAIGIKMAIAGARMGSSLPYREGLTLEIAVDDFFENAFLPDTVYCLKVYTEKGLAYASEFNGKQPQHLAIAVQQRSYYRVEVTNESDGFIVGISNPIWLDY